MEVILMVGIAGSGKTTYTNDRFPNHARVSLDMNKKHLPRDERFRLMDRYEQGNPLGLERQPPGMPPNPAGPGYAVSLSGDQGSGNRRAEYVQMADFLKAGRDVVVDDTNLTRELRWPYVLLAKKHGANVRAVYFTNIRAARYRNSKRAGDDRVSEDAVTGQVARMESPTVEEWFDSILVKG